MPASSIAAFALVAGLVTATYLGLVRTVVAPLHAAAPRPLTADMNALADLLRLPVEAALGKSPHAGGLGRGPSGWADHAGALVVYSLVAAVAMLAVRGRGAESGAPGGAGGGRRSPRVPGRLSRRRFLALGLGGTAGLSGAYSLFVEPGWLRTTRLRFPIRGLHPALDGLRLVQLTDVHLGPWMSVARVGAAVARANALEPDVIVLTGDYVHASPEYIAPVAAELGKLRARIGILGVLGNHDWWEGAVEMRAAFRSAGLPLIDNDRAIVTPGRTIVPRAEEGLCIAGVGDLWEDSCRFDRALGGLPESMPRILLSHNPDAAERGELTRSGLRVDLMISGHTHGGQISLPLFGAPVIPSRHGRKYARGLVRGPVCPVFVSTGIGVTILPVRWGVRPEIVEIEFFRQET